MKIIRESLNNKGITLFRKKISNYDKIIPLKISNNKGIIKHFPTANKEWVNSIYSYNKNITKYLPIKDKILFSIVKSYFNLYNYKEQKKINKKNVLIRFRRLSILKIFISKAEKKHTSSKVIITLYIYNRQKKYLINKLNNIVILKGLSERVKLIEKQSLKISEEIEKERTLISCSNMLQNTINTYKNQRYRDLIKKSLEKEILTIYIRQLLHFNKSKFEDTYLLTFSNIIRKVYGKDVEFNIINLKYIHLNSDILTQLIALKLRRRKNYILKILKKCFKIIRLSPLNKMTLTHYLKKDLIKNISIFNILSLNKKEKTESLSNLVLNFIKFKYINGLRLEAKGRLSKRRTASKSVFKFKYKGNLKNIDSSYKGLSTVTLRGHVKSNIQFTKLNYKTRNGSFGIKGWIGSK